MGDSMIDKMDRMEKMPLIEQRAFAEGLTNYMVRNLHLWKKLEFIKKTYGILIVGLVISSLISTPFMKNPSGTVNWLSDHSWILWLACIVLVLQIGFYLTVLGFLLTGQNLLLLVYCRIMTAFPLNIVWSLLYVVSFTLVVDSALAAYDFAALCSVFLYTAFAVLGLVLYISTIRNPDFKQLYAYLVPVATAAVIWFFLHTFGNVYNERFEHFSALLISIVLGWIVVFDTQLIFGAKIERGRKYPYQAKMYAMAAYEMYFDLFIHFYLGALNLFPATDESLSAEA